jgi:hypothetical protein
MVKGPEQSAVLELILVHSVNELRLLFMVNVSFLLSAKRIHNHRISM